MNTVNTTISVVFRLAAVMVILLAGSDAYPGLHHERVPAGKIIKAPLDSSMDSLMTLYSSGSVTDGAALAGFAIPVSTTEEDLYCVVNDSLRLCFLKITSPGAGAVGLNFSVFSPEPGSRILIYDNSKNLVLGAFDNNITGGTFTTTPLPGETIVIEYQEPFYQDSIQNTPRSVFEIESIIHLGSEKGAMSGNEKGVGDSGDCNVNINCTEGEKWQREKRGIVRMLMRVGSSYYWCTGSLVNNTAMDAAPLLLSAYHCGRNADSSDLKYWQFYFNFERPACINQGSPAYNMLYGAELLAEGPIAGGSDFRLLMLDTPPPAHWLPFWNGWDVSGNPSDSGVSIHHPGGDVKKVSTYTTKLATTTPLFGSSPMATNSAWAVIWSETDNGHGVTEGGSSGAPIFSSEKKIIGTLSGGSASCSNPNARDFFGKMSYHWDQNDPGPGSSLDIFLDPLQTGTKRLEGFDPYGQELPPPGFLSASTDSDSTLIKWYAPGKAPNNRGWYRYFNDYSHFSWAGPERATLFDPPALGLNYPLRVQKVAHSFVEGHGAENLWPDDRFRFRIYDSDGLTLLYESEVLNAEHLSEYIYELETYIEFHRPFYVSVKPLDNSGHPSSLIQRVNLGSGSSFFGSAGNWTPHEENREGSFSHHSAIYILGCKQDKWENTGTEPPPGALGLKHKVTGTENSFSGEIIHGGFAEPDKYTLYRNDTIIQSTTSGKPLEYTDLLFKNSLVSYYVTAGYNGRSSEPSNKVYLFGPDNCEYRITNWPYQEVFDDSFDDSCWITRTFNKNLWTLTDTLFYDPETLTPYIGDLFWTSRNEPGEETDQWLIMPEIDFTELDAPALMFMLNYRELSKAGEGDHLSVMVSIQGESFKKIWDSRFHTGPAIMDPSGWYKVNLRLNNAGDSDNVRIAFRHQGATGSSFSIDHIEIISSEGISHDLLISVEPEFAGEVTGQGRYIEGEVIQLNAVPNIAYRFNNWTSGNNIIGSEQEISFIMPGSDQHITALFSPVEETSLPPGPVEKLAVVYPNPVTSQLWVEFGTTLSSADLSIVSPHGQIIMKRNIGNVSAGERILLNTSGMKPGTYLLIINSIESYEVFRVSVVN